MSTCAIHSAGAVIFRVFKRDNGYTPAEYTIMERLADRRRYGQSVINWPYVKNILLIPSSFRKLIAWKFTAQAIVNANSALFEFQKGRCFLIIF